MKGFTETARSKKFLHVMTLLLLLGAVVVLPMQVRASTFGLDSVAENGTVGAVNEQPAFTDGTEAEFGALASPGAPLYTTLTLGQENGGNLGCRPVPIPSALWLLGSGLLGLVGFRRKLKK